MTTAVKLSELINGNSSQIVVPSGGIAFTDLDSSNDLATANEAYVMGQDGYETGTWTPTLPSASTATISNIYGNARYTKIGNIVHAYFNIKIGTNSDSSNLLKVSLPFSSTNNQTGTTGTEGVAILMYSNSTAVRGIVYSAQNTSSFQDANFTTLTYADASDTFLYAYVVYQSA